MHDLRMAFELWGRLSGHSTPFTVAALTSRMTRRNDSMRPSAVPRSGAVCKRTFPKATAAGYATWNVMTVSSAASNRSNARWRSLSIHVKGHQLGNAHTHGEMNMEDETIAVAKTVGARKNGFAIDRVVPDAELKTIGVRKTKRLTVSREGTGTVLPVAEHT